MPGFSRFALVGCLVPALCLLAGCFHVPLPLPEGETVYGRHVFDEADQAFFQAGQVTRDEVLFRFGEPDLSSRDERVIGYVWENFAGVYVVLMFPYIPIAAGSYPRTHLVMMEFDDQGRLIRSDSREFSDWTSTIGAEVNEWIPGWTSVCGEKRSHELITLWPVQLAPVARQAAPLRVKVEPVADGRALGGGNSGHYLGRWLGHPYEIVSRQTVDGIMKWAMEAQLRAAGHLVVDRDADIVIRGTIDYFQFTQSALSDGLFSPTRFATLAAADLRVEICDARHPQPPRVLALSGRSRRETAFPQDPPYEELAKDCIAQLLAQFAAGVEWQPSQRINVQAGDFAEGLAQP